MSFKKKLEEFIGIFDTYDKSFQVQFRYKTAFQTTFGRFVSAFLILIGLVALILFYIYLEIRDEQKIVTFKHRALEPPEFFMSSNYLNITY